ncbi:MAG: heterodisulfide reductase-related iron-sulfur binding cluster [Bacillota bacterium]|nr:heterodisulfide reductase-related iron-sulfur binding cluster [Bacillota bacterium]
MHKYYEQFETCREHHIPFCSDACPFHLDFLDIQQKLTQNKYNTAYKALRNALVFPEIVAALCPAYCEKSCVRKDIDAPVRINLLEKTILSKATRKKPNEYNVPAKKGRIAVIGAGLSGMGFAFRLASKKYDVTVYEKEGQIGGHLSILLPEEVYLEDFKLQFQFEEYTLKLNSEVEDIEELAKEGYDVIYVATGKGGKDFGLLDMENAQPCKMLGDTAVFAGGSLCGKDTIHALADGINVARASEVFLKTRTLEYPVPEAPSKVVANEDLLVKTPAIPATDADGTFTDEEAVSEAARCIRCQCDACRTNCDLVGFFDKWPRTMRDEIIITSKPSKSLVHKNPAMRYINACTQCDLFSETCPSNIDLCDMVKNARYKIHTLDKTPGAFRQYFLRDMEFANGEFAAISKAAPGREKSAFAYFPGCNLGALHPGYVYESYKWLLAKEPDTGLLLKCCSVPVDWNGEEERHLEEIKKLKQDWEGLGKPMLVMACMTCRKHIRQYLPEIPTVSLYEVMAESGFEKNTRTMKQKTFAIFDPCSARNEKNVQSAVRALAASADLSIEELPKNDRHGCCGFGGMGEIAAPAFTDYVAKKRSQLSDDPYLVYCSNCRDIFRDRGKEAVHILDVLFDIDPKNHMRQPTVTERRQNRVVLKERLLREIWGEEMKNKPEESPYRLILSDDIRQKADKLKLLDEDICDVIRHSEETGRRTFDPETGHYKAYKEIGHITCWVEYGSMDNSAEYEIFNVYTHRMRIELEAVFNGKKVDL